MARVLVIEIIEFSCSRRELALCTIHAYSLRIGTARIECIGRHPELVTGPRPTTQRISCRVLMLARDGFPKGRRGSFPSQASVLAGPSLRPAAVEEQSSPGEVR